MCGKCLDDGSSLLVLPTSGCHWRKGLKTFHDSLRKCISFWILPLWKVAKFIKWSKKSVSKGKCLQKTKRGTPNMKEAEWQTAEVSLTSGDSTAVGTDHGSCCQRNLELLSPSWKMHKDPSRKTFGCIRNASSEWLEESEALWKQASCAVGYLHGEKTVSKWKNSSSSLSCPFLIPTFKPAFVWALAAPSAFPSQPPWIPDFSGTSPNYMWDTYFPSAQFQIRTAYLWLLLVAGGTSTLTHRSAENTVTSPWRCLHSSWK